VKVKITLHRHAAELTWEDPTTPTSKGIILSDGAKAPALIGALTMLLRDLGADITYIDGVPGSKRRRLS
jgi:hypothetical protein